MAIKIINPIINHVEGGGAKFNIHYGLNAPDDTSMLWVETEREPSGFAMGVKAMTETYQFETMTAINSVYRAFSMKATVGGKVYLFGGSSGGTKTTDIRMYDPESDLMSTLSQVLPVANRNHCQNTAVFGTKIYIFGGEGSPSSIVVFDTANNSIEELTVTMPTARQYHSVAVVGTKAYIFGGYSDGTITNKITVFDSQTNGFDDLSVTLPYASFGVAVCAIGTKIYMFGGCNGSTWYSTSRVLDTETNKISSATALPYKRDSCGISAIGTMIFIFGGQQTTSYFGKEVFLYDTVANTMKTLSGVTLKAGDGYNTFVIDGKIYTFSNSIEDDIQRFNVIGAELSYNQAYAQASLSSNLFDIVSGDNSINIGVGGVYIGNEINQAEKVDAYLYNKSTSTWTKI